MKLRQALDEKQHDLRIRDRLLAEGKVKSTDIQKYLKDLPDDEKNASFSDEGQSQATE
jgi:hypothetical protein